MDWTDCHFRQLCRLISRRTWLWTEMVVDKTIIHSPQTDKWLWFPPEQHPIVLQLGGSDPDTLRQAAAVAARYGWGGACQGRVCAGAMAGMCTAEPAAAARSMPALAHPPHTHQGRVCRRQRAPAGTTRST